MAKIQLFSTGGTIAKKYDEISGELIFDDDHIQKMLIQGRCSASIEVTSILSKDSLEMTDFDRDIIFRACQDTFASKIIITHGTDTMVQSAKKLSTIYDKTIVLTGAMIPYAFKNSDALFNLSGAISAVCTLPNGVYICINGEIFLWNNVIKDIKKGRFEKLF